MLILVHIIIIAHVALWLLTGMRTVTPVEPSEAIYTLEQGLVNAGFVFFLLAIIATLIFGRIFCGWACHVVALQDLCAWMMKRLGVHPKPFRSRLLIFIPLGLAIYMFIWPTFQRDVLQPLAGESWSHVAPYLGHYPPRPELQAAFTTTDFWATFPPWYLAIPFLTICGFGAVYFLGAKGFCTYGCPYGGFFAPIDRAAPGRIVVNENCEGCGHCTAVCTSNVRVHEEVREFGMVVDSGCMKCMDCVSVCPNQALSYAFTIPPIARRSWLTGWRSAKRSSRRYDLSWPEELAAAGGFLILLVAYRGMFNSVPLLMAVGMAAIGTFLLWKLWSLARIPNVRIQSMQLKYKGSLKPAGVVFGALGVFVLASSAWGTLVKYNLYFGDVYDARVTVPMATVFAPDYTPDQQQRHAATRSARHFLRAGPPSEGGFGWNWTRQRHIRLAWVLAVAGEDEQAAHHLRAVIHADARDGTGPRLDLVEALIALIERPGQGGGEPTQIADELHSIIASGEPGNPALAEIRIGLATLELDAGHRQSAADEAQLAADAAPGDLAILLAAAGILLEAGDQTSSLEVLRRAMKLDINDPGHKYYIANLLAALGQHEEAHAWFLRAREPAQDQTR